MLLLVVVATCVVGFREGETTNERVEAMRWHDNPERLLGWARFKYPNVPAIVPRQPNVGCLPHFVAQKVRAIDVWARGVDNHE